MGQSNGKLTVKGIAKLTDKGRYGDGRGLYLQVVVSKTGKLIRSWLFRYQVGAVEKTMGFGPLDDVSLEQAREMARQQRELLRQGIDPVVHRDRQRAERQAQAVAEEARSKTFEDVVQLYYRQHSAKWKSLKHARQFLSSLEAHAYPILGRVRVADISRDLILKVLLRDDFWANKTQTASRVRGRIEAVLNFAKVNHWRPEGENPAAWGGNLEHALPARNQIQKVEHHAAALWRGTSFHGRAAATAGSGRPGLGVHRPDRSQNRRSAHRRVDRDRFRQQGLDATSGAHERRT
jgi:hypothetical protein